MFKNKYPGKFIAVEGLDGSGSTNQAELIAQYLKNDKKNVWLTREPTNSLIGVVIKSHLSGDWKIDSAEGLQLLFAADRANHLEKEIIPRLKNGINIISDRYFLSSIAYGSIDISNTDWLCQINDPFILPDLTVLIKASAKTCLKNIKEDNKALTLFASEEKLQKVWKAYESVHKKYPNIYLFDGDKKEEEIFEEIKKSLKKIGL